MHWEDRVGREGYDKIEAGILKLRASRKRSVDQHKAYETFTNAGMTPEEADEYINLELDME